MKIKIWYWIECAIVNTNGWAMCLGIGKLCAILEVRMLEKRLGNEDGYMW